MQALNSNSTAPSTIGKYRVLKKLGSGATADVYIAETSQKESVALKVFKNDSESTRNTEVVKRELKYAM